MQFIRKVYAILTLQLLLTTALSSISFFSDSYKGWIQSNQWMMWVSMFGAIGFMLLTYWKRKSYVSATPRHAGHISILTAYTAHEPCIPYGLHRT
jgi:FtsH-binding integral membrane protein